MIFKNQFHLFVYSIGLVLILACSSTSSGSNDIGDPDPDPSEPSNYLQINLHPNTTYQTIRGFGASDAWSTQFVGKYWPLDKRNQIADYLFSSVNDSQGNPKGIGLNMWRFNIGGGSAEQGTNSGISDEWRRAESFLTNNGYDWTKHEGQRWFLKAAQQRGVNQFIGFSNSPPTILTKNGKAHSSGGSSGNLNSSNYEAYADFLIEVVTKIYQNDGVLLNHISPFNEPQWDWTGGQEGSPWLNSEIAEITRVIDQKITDSNTNTKIEIAEAGQLNYLYENDDKSGRGNQIEDFFNSSSSNYIGNLNNLSQKIAGHSYYTTYGTSYLLEVREYVADQIKATNSSLEFWMTEYCVLEDNNQINGNGRDLGMDPALYAARVIYTDLTVANASSWQWWLAVSPYDYKDGLVYIDYSKSNGNVYDSKLLWALGNYSRFIKPGYKRISVSRSDNKNTEQSLNGLLVSAYKDPGSSKSVVVIVNQNSHAIPVKINNNNQNFQANLYITSGLNNDNLRFDGTASQDDIIEIPSKSIVTYTLN